MRKGALSAVETEGLEKRFGRVRALRGLDFALEPGSLVRVAGPNGAGKSTLLRILAGLTRPTRGSLRVDGTDPFGAHAVRARAQTGYLGQSAGLYAELTVGENLGFNAELRGLPADSIEQAIESLGLESVRDLRVQTLSQGFRRRAGLARALLGRPALLLLDEPWNMLSQLFSAGAAFLPYSYLRTFPHKIRSETL